MTKAGAPVCTGAHHDPARDAAAAAQRAGVTVLELADSAQFNDASALLARVWGTSPDASPLPSDLLASLAHAGSCVMGAYAERELAGVAVCLAGPPCSREVYSVIAAAVAPAGRGVGTALKLGQRAWSLDRGADRMVWTFDPLVRRNAHFNLTKLGARATEYRSDFYPPMHDAINRQDLTDRLVAEWNLADPAPGCAGIDGVVPLLASDGSRRPAPRDAGDAGLLSVMVPDDIEQMRRDDPDLAREWRIAVREALQPRMAQGYRIVGFAGSGSYILQRGAHD